MPPYEDDPGIPDDEALWRRLPPYVGWYKPDGSLTPLSFLDRRTPEGLVSVHRSSLTTLGAIQHAHPDSGIAEVVARIPRDHDHLVSGDPIAGDGSHALIVPKPEIPGIKKRRAAAYKIAKAALIVVPVPELPVATPGPQPEPPDQPEI